MKPSSTQRLAIAIAVLATVPALLLLSGCASDPVVNAPISQASAPSLSGGRPASYPERLNREIDQIMASNPALTRQEAYQRAEMRVPKTPSNRGNEPAYGKELDVMDW